MYHLNKNARVFPESSKSIGLIKMINQRRRSLLMKKISSSNNHSFQDRPSKCEKIKEDQSLIITKINKLISVYKEDSCESKKCLKPKKENKPAKKNLPFIYNSAKSIQKPKICLISKPRQSFSIISATPKISLKKSMSRISISKPRTPDSIFNDLSGWEVTNEII